MNKLKTIFTRKFSFLLIAVFVLSIVSILFFNTKTFSSAPTNDLDYFKGNWTVTLRNNPENSFSWTVKEDLNQSWLSGVVERDSNRISTDFWRINGQKIERFAFTGNSVFVKIESSGWKGDKMIMTGILSDKDGEIKVRETITKVSENKFNALWEMEGSDGKWKVFGDEICTI